jgi:quercetin dioxygenase-like cupin family protein
MRIVSALALLAALPLTRPDRQETPNQAAFTLEDVLARLERTERAWHAILDIPSLELGLYRLPTGAEDHQRPHTRDEIYYVTQGLATLEAGAAEHPAIPGAILFVRAGVDHRFRDIEEDLVALVFFSNARAER